MRGETSSTIASTIHIGREDELNAMTRRPEIRKLLLRRDTGRAFLSMQFVGGHQDSPIRMQADSVLLENGDMVFFQAVLDDQLNQVQNDDGLIVSIQSELLAGSESKTDLDKVLWGIDDSAIIFGMLGYAGLSRYIDSSAEVSVTEESPGVALDAVSRYGHIKLWLDRDYGFLPRRLNLVKRGSDISNGRRVDEINMLGGDGVWPAGGVEELRWSAKDIILARSGDIPYIQQITIVQETVSKAGPIVTQTTTAKVESVDFDPTFRDRDFTTSLRIPKNFPVTVVGASYLPYVWDGERVVARISDLDDLTGDGAKSKTLFQILVLSANVVLIIVLVVFLSKKWRGFPVKK